ncbi:uncharacterized protein LOC135104410 isoform X1 [Scylla paramamosain]|uniref:uncharacterized protein LOC135104410 isoform X1 n=1 Tax=Scylla paramamosain TaxID=85552 RepID=UPI00308335C3
MKIPDHENTGQWTNVWTQDSVFAHVEKELREMEDRLGTVRKTFTLSGELFHFIEMELKKLNSTVMLESSPRVFPQGERFSEISRSLPNVVPPHGRKEARRRTLSTGALDNTRGKSDTRRHIRIHSESTATGTFLLSSAQSSAQSGRHYQSSNKKKNKNSFHSSVLCLKDLDQSLPPCFMNFRSTYTVEQKVPGKAAQHWVTRDQASGAQRGCKSSLALKRCAEDSAGGNSFKKRKDDEKIKIGKAKKKKMPKIISQCKGKNINMEVYSASILKRDKSVSSTSSNSSVPCVAAGDTQGIPHPAQSCTWSGSASAHTKTHLKQPCLLSTGSCQGIPQVCSNTRLNRTTQVNQGLQLQVDSGALRATSVPGNVAQPLQGIALQPLLEVPVAGVSRPLNLVTKSRSEETSNFPKGQSASEGNRHFDEEPPPHYYSNSSVGRTAAFFPLFSPAFLCICSAPRVCVLSPSTSQTVTQGTEAVVQQQGSEVPGCILAECGGTTSNHRGLPLNESKRDPPSSDDELSWSSRERFVEERRSESNEANKPESLSIKLASSCKYGGGLLGREKNESSKYCMFPAVLNRTSTLYNCQEKKETSKTEFPFPPAKPCSVIIQVPQKSLQVQMNAGEAPAPTSQDEPPQKQILNVGTKSPSYRRRLKAKCVTDAYGCGEFKCEKIDRLFTRGEKCLSVIDSLNSIDKRVTCTKDQYLRYIQRKTDFNANEEKSCTINMSSTSVLKFVPAAAGVSGDSCEDQTDSGTLSGTSALDVEPVYRFLGSDACSVQIQPSKAANMMNDWVTINNFNQTKQDSGIKSEETRCRILHEEPYQKRTNVNTSGIRSVEMKQHDHQHALRSEHKGNLEGREAHMPSACELHAAAANPPVNSASTSERFNAIQNESAITSSLHQAPLNLASNERKETLKQNFQKLQPPEMGPSIQEVYRADVLLEENKDEGLSVYTINYQLLPPIKATWTADSAILLRRNPEVAASAPYTGLHSSVTSLKVPLQCRLCKKSCTCLRKTPLGKESKGSFRTRKLKALSPVKMQVTNVAGTASIIYTLVDVASQVAANSKARGNDSTDRDLGLMSCGKSQNGRLNISCSDPQASSYVCQMCLGVDTPADANVTRVLKQVIQADSKPSYFRGSASGYPRMMQWQNGVSSVENPETSASQNGDSWHPSVSLAQDHLQPLQRTKKRKSIDESYATSSQSKNSLKWEELSPPLCSTNSHNLHSTRREEISPHDSEGATQTCSKRQGGEDGGGGGKGDDILRQAIEADLFDVLVTDDNSGCMWPLDEEAATQEQDYSSGQWEGKLTEREPGSTPVYMTRNETDCQAVFRCELSIESHTQGNYSITTPLISDGDDGVDENTTLKEEEPHRDVCGDLTNIDKAGTEMTESDEDLDDGDDLDGWTHADQLPFRCEFCGRLFKHKRSRDRHVKLHTGDKKYKCCHCEAAFSRSDHLKIHKKTHDTQKPYQCSVCNRGYNTAAALTAHMQNHKAKLTAHALNQLLKDAQAPVETHALTQLLRDSAAAETHAQSLNHFLKDGQKEHLLSPKGIEIGAGSSPGELTSSPAGEPSPSLSPVATVRCPVCHTHCKSQAHLQRHVSRYHGEELPGVPLERPASRGGGSGTSSVGGASSAASTPSPRPPSSLPSPRPLSNPLLSLVAGKLACLYCSRDGFPSLEALQLHLQSSHGSVMNGEVRDMTTMLGLHPSLGASLSASGMATSLASPLGPGSSRGVSCELCGARVGGVTALQRHVVTAHTFTDLLARAAEGVFCAQCLLPFSNPGALAEHIKLVHASPVLSAVLNKRPPSPPTDTPTDLSKKSRHDGLTSDLPASTLLCSQCNAPFTNFEAFRRHLKSHLDGGEQVSATGGSGVQLACPECRLPLTSEAALEGHVATHLGVTSTEYGCQACLKLFSKPDELQKHLMDIHAHHLYRCALCKEMFDSKVSIQVHFAVKHSNECKVHKCTRCSLIFRSQSEFEGHIRVTHIRRSQMGGDSVGGGSVGGGGGSYRCLLCPLSLSSEAELAAHVSTHQRQFQCSLCDDAFHVEFLLDKHMQTQHNSELNGNVPQPENLAKPRRSPQKKDLRCDICDAEFSTDSALMTHRKQAHNIKSGSVGVTAKVAAASLSLFCAYCSEACKSRGDLEAHMKSHQGNGGRHKCNICDELCPSAALLAQHKLTHVKVVSGSACAVCREPLTSEQQFTSHQNEHHPSPLPQPCVVCRQTLVTDMEVSVHARFHATQAAQAAAAASVASVLSSGELHPQSTNSLVFTTGSNAPTTTTSSTNGSSNSSSSSNSTSPRLSPSQRCQECHIKFETAEEAEAHTAVHQQQQQQGFGRSMASSSRTYQCIKCQESFASEAEIEAHVASHLLHEGSVHECHLCRATFDTPLRLQCHLIEHTFEGCGSFTCYMCSSVFTTASRLQQHMVEHGLSARPYDCHHCHQRFFFRAELENHALSHPEAAKGGCRECLASFPDLPRRSARRPSLSCGTSNPNVVSHVAQNPGKSDLRPTRPSSPVRDEIDIGPTNGHASSVADNVED